MPKIVELLGASGVGKSSLYYSLQKKWEKKDNWAIYHDFIYKRKDKSLVSIMLKLKSFLYKVSETDYHWNDGKIADHKKEFAVKYSDFIAVFLDLVNEKAKYGFDGVDKRFFMIFYMLKSIERLHNVIEKKSDERVCLIDEALLSRIMHLNSPDFTQNDLLSYLDAMPLPDAVIYLHAPADQIIHRIRKRDRTSTLHAGMEEVDILKYTVDTQQLMEYSLDILKGKGVSILRLDAGQSLSALTSESVSFLNQLYLSS